MAGNFNSDLKCTLLLWHLMLSGPDCFSLKGKHIILKGNLSEPTELILKLVVLYIYYGVFCPWIKGNTSNSWTEP